MICHADAAIRTGKHVAAAAAQKCPRIAPPIQQNHGLLAAPHTSFQLLLQRTDITMFFPCCRNSALISTMVTRGEAWPRFAPGDGNIAFLLFEQRHDTSRSMASPSPTTALRLSAARAAMPLLARVARRLILFVRSILFFVDNDEPQILQRRKNRGARAYDNPGMTFANAAPLVKPFARRHSAMQQRHLIRETGDNKPAQERSQSYFGNKESAVPP